MPTRSRVWTEQATHAQLSGSCKATITGTAVYLDRGGNSFVMSLHEAEMLASLIGRPDKLPKAFMEYLAEQNGGS